MSDVDGRLEATRKALLKNSIFFCIGWFILGISVMGLQYLGTATSGIYKFAKFINFIGWGIIGGPKIWLAMLGGFGAALKPDYEVVTTYGDGRKESDGGTQSVQMNFLVRLVLIAVLYVIGGLLTIITLVFLTIKYIVLHIAARPKPAFIKSGLFIIVMNIAVFIGSIILGATIQQIGTSIQRAADFAERGVKTSGEYRYAPNEDKSGVIIEAYLSKKGGDIVIPATFDGLPVVGFTGSFTGIPITSVVFPDTVTFIDSGFKYCTELKQATLPKNLKYIRHGVFEETGLTSIVIPEGVTDIGNYVFRNCENLTSVTLPRSIARIGESTFEGCTSLTDVSIPSGRAINYGVYNSVVFGGNEFTDVAGMGQWGQFVADQDYMGGAGDSYKKAFKGCTRLSAASRQAIQDSGYIGEF